MGNNLIFCFLIINLSHIIRTQYQGYYNGPIMEETIYPTEYNSRPYGSSGGILPYADLYEYEDPEECRCKCNKCYKPKPCCVQTCMSCSQANVVFVPYPYPLIVNPPTTTTAKPTTTTACTSSTSPIYRPPLEPLKNAPKQLNDLIAEAENKNGDSKYILTSLRRTKSNWLPRYGIVPIPDQLAENLMTQMRSMKGLQNKRDGE